MRGLLPRALLNLKLLLCAAVVELGLHPFGRAAFSGPSIFGLLWIAILDLDVTFRAALRHRLIAFDAEQFGERNAEGRGNRRDLTLQGFDFGAVPFRDLGVGPERALERALRPLGPVVAVGEPGERIPPVGAARLYITNEHWQEVVRQLITQAQVVVMRIGDTEGWWWELEQLVKANDPTKLVMFLPPGDRFDILLSDNYEKFRLRADTILPRALPDNANGLFICFKDDWPPYELTPLSSSGKWRRWLLNGTLAPTLRDALRQKFNLPKLAFGASEWASLIFWTLFVIGTLLGMKV